MVCMPLAISESTKMTKQRILVTGAKGFIGKRLVSRLERLAKEVITPEREEYDLRKEDHVLKLFEDTKPETVIHLAGDIGGIAYLGKNPGSLFYNNEIMNLLLMEFSRRHGVGKFVGFGSALAYPGNATPPFKESDIWKGDLNKGSAAYGLTKRMLLFQSQAYRSQYNFHAVHIILASLYGPGEEDSHVIPSLMKKFHEARLRDLESVTVWGTGNATRDLLYVDDAAEAIVTVLESYDKPEPLNIGSGKETTIRELAESIAKVIGYGGRINWDSSKEEGPKRILLDCQRAEREIDFRAKTSLMEGLARTKESYGFKSA